jgi:PAS domain-containing protein
VAEIFLQAQTTFTTGAQALQRDVGAQRVVARADGGIAIDPIAGDEMGGVRSDGADAADRTRSGYHRQIQQILSSPAEDFVRVGQNPACCDIDDDLTGAQDWIGHGLDGRWRSERLVRLEQGRSVSPSVTTIDALARALRLSKAEHAHLRALTRNADRRAFRRESVPETIRCLVESLNQPAYVTGRRWDLLAWNAAADEIFGFSRLAEADRNILLSVLTTAAARRLFGADRADQAKRMVAQFRATHDLWAGDPAFLDLLERLRQGCPEFATWWQAHDIRGVAAGQKLLRHPKKGSLRFAYASFQANDDPALKLAIYTPVRGDLRNG